MGYEYWDVWLIKEPTLETSYHKYLLVRELLLLFTLFNLFNICVSGDYTYEKWDRELSNCFKVTHW